MSVRRLLVDTNVLLRFLSGEPPAQAALGRKLFTRAAAGDLWVLGMFRRVANSRFVQWGAGRRRPDHVTTTNFQTLPAENHRARALRPIQCKRLSIKDLS